MQPSTSTIVPESAWTDDDSLAGDKSIQFAWCTSLIGANIFIFAFTNIPIHQNTKSSFPSFSPQKIYSHTQSLTPPNLIVSVFIFTDQKPLHL
ncbi:hypothetical protein RJT34_20231 [Clitoria ternatea]|uniref:Uncharacterized protein n=1 Tax=Clitoria ternatea TaxID=43366 RepID=A0AAN9ISG0_CLITE